MRRASSNSDAGLGESVQGLSETCLELAIGQLRVKNVSSPTGKVATMSKVAWTYVWAVMLAGVAMSTLSLRHYPSITADDWMILATLATFATLAQLFKADAPHHMAFFATPVFLFAGVLLLNPFLFVVLVAVPHLCEWVHARWHGKEHLGNWYIQPFNIAMHIITGFGASWIYTTLATYAPSLIASSAPFAMIISAASYLLFGQLLLGQALVLARGKTWRELRIWEGSNLLPEFIMLCLGSTIAVLWPVNAWLILPALSPLVLMYRALKIPLLQQEAQSDPKTGLLNARYFNKLALEELERARRFDRPVTVIMADLDLLRNVNNTYGHLAGDSVLQGIAQVIQKTLRDYDLAGRFGGEEFVIVLPETELVDARVAAERVRKAIEETPFHISTSDTPIRVTMSLGVACFPENGTTLTDLTHEADIAVYQAKLQGRNRVVCAVDVPHSIRFEHEGTSDPSATEGANYAAAFARKRAAEDVSGEDAATVPVLDSDVAALPEPPTTPDPVQVAPVIAPSPSAPASNAASSADEVENKPIWRRAVKAEQSFPQNLLPIFVGTVIATGVGLTLLGTSQGLMVVHSMLGLLVVLAIISELLQISVYGDNTISVSLVPLITSGLLGGIPEVALVSLAIAMTVHFRAGRLFGSFHKLGFNWATHLLAGTIPIFLLDVNGVPQGATEMVMLSIMMIVVSIGYYIVESSLISCVISLSSRTRFVQTWRNQFRWLAGHYVLLGMISLFLSIAFRALGPLGATIFFLPIFMLRYAQKQYIERTDASARELRRMNHELTQANQEVTTASHAIQQLNSDLKRSNQELLLTLARMLDARDPYVGGHATKVAEYARVIACEMGFPPDRVEQMYHAGLLHDIGKIAIPEHILNKRSKLTDEEYEHIKLHATIGADLIETSQTLRHLAPYIRHHHERWDGRGYPDGLAGECIPVEARILNICDAVEAMASDRPYHRGMALHEVLAEVERCAGTQFDPAIAAAFVRVAGREGQALIINSAQQIAQQRAEHFEPVPAHSASIALPA